MAAQEPTSSSGAEQLEERRSSESPRRCPVVGIGASAGGFDALRRLLGAVPENPDLAFVIVQHLPRDKQSLAAKVLSRFTCLPVIEVGDETVVAPNHVYVVPAGKYLQIDGGRLSLAEMEGPRGVPIAIDFFFRSLARAQRPCDVGVILSGTGSDGTQGVKALKSAGGLVIAQDPASAEHPGMPQSAIDAGAVDQILAPEEIPAVILRFASHPYVREAAPVDDIGATKDASRQGASEGLDAVLALLKSECNRDFRHYKANTLMRRTRRRMLLHGMELFSEYLAFLKQNAAEREALAKDLLISVTDFFRDPEAWTELAAIALAPLVAAKTNDQEIRVWVVGCATGEEAYTVAILLLEALRSQGKTCRLQVFASDIDRDAIQFARAGRYPRSIVADVSPQRLEQFFQMEEDELHFRVNKTLREAVIFSDQNVMSDPPFSNLDLICCRNVLIYLKPEIQSRIISLFHFSLRHPGYLMLGSAETVGRRQDLFEMINKRWRIYFHIGERRPDSGGLPLASQIARRPQETISTRPPRDVRLTRLAQQRLLDMVAPNAVLIDRQSKILYINGNIDAYLTHRSGVPSDDLLSKARSGLRSRLRSAIGKAFAENRNVSATCRVTREAKDFAVRIHIRLLPNSEREDTLALVLFEEVPGAATPPSIGSEGSPDAASHQGSGAEAAEVPIEESSIISQLEEELSAVKDDLQLTVEQFETSHEEFKASNEEVMSVNEELQSTNEELETSKEELQSLNEELSTVNQQLASKIEELERKHADLENLIAATNIATICLDSELSIRWFTEATKQVIRIKSTDQGRPLNDLAHDFSDDSLVEDCHKVLRDLVPVESEIGCHDGRAFIRRVVPFRTEDHQVSGVVITLMDITTQRRREAELRASEERFRRALSVEGIGILFFDPAGKLLDCNEWFLQVTGYQRSDVAAGKITSLGMTPPEWVGVTCDQLEKLKSTGRIGPYEKELFCNNGSRLWMMLSGSSLEDGTVVVHCIDVHDRKHAEQSLQDLNRTLEQQVAQRTELMGILQHVTRVANEARSIDEAMRAALIRICQYDGWKVGRVWQPAREGSAPMASRSIWHVESDEMHPIDRLVEFQRLYDQMLASSDTGLVAAVMQSARSVWLDDIAQSDPWRQQLPGLGLHAAVAFPITIDDAVVAVMEFFSDQPSRRQSRFIEIVPDVGIQLGHVIRRKRLEYFVASVANEEQRRIGRELHDGISQQLTGGTLIAESLRQKLAAEQSPHSVNALHLVQILKETHADLRQLSNGLLPSTLDSAHLRPALYGMLREVSDRFNVPIELDDQGFDETVINNDATAFLVYQICREAVHNAIKHACPNHIRVQLVTDQDFRMTVEDDGKGFDTADVAKRANGLPIMTYRAESVGGTLRIESAEQIGTKVVLTIPRLGCES